MPFIQPSRAASQARSSMTNVSGVLNGEQPAQLPMDMLKAQHMPRQHKEGLQGDRPLVSQPISAQHDTQRA